MNASPTPVSTWGSRSRPPASGAVATRTFFTHCLGRMARSAAGRREVRVTTSLVVDIRPLGYRARRRAGAVHGRVGTPGAGPTERRGCRGPTAQPHYGGPVRAPER